jgi:RNA polymerase sigma factor (sigma-70 family)
MFVESVLLFCLQIPVDERSADAHRVRSFKMSNDSTVELQKLIDDFSQGGSAARRALIERATNRLRRLAAKMVGESFPDLRAIHDVDSVVNETWMQLVPALEATSIDSVQDFFRLAALKIRQVLLNMVDRARRRAPEIASLQGQSSANWDPSQASNDPAKLAIWSELHQRVAQLDDDLRQVFELYYYLEIPQPEIARLLGIHRRQVSRLWLKAVDRLMIDLNLSEGIL